MRLRSELPWPAAPTAPASSTFPSRGPAGSLLSSPRDMLLCGLSVCLSFEHAVLPGQRAPIPTWEGARASVLCHLCAGHLRERWGPGGDHGCRWGLSSVSQTYSPRLEPRTRGNDVWIAGMHFPWFVCWKTILDGSGATVRVDENNTFFFWWCFFLVCVYVQCCGKSWLLFG